LNDIAAATQAVFEYCVVNIAAWTKIRTFSPNLALAGGGALNRDAVDLLRDRWDTVHVPQNPGDPGSCIGAVLAKTKQKISIDRKWNK
jgi:predicted NodU family carbamoyl transferase